jgi:hypothetical protein
MVIQHTGGGGTLLPIGLMLLCVLSCLALAWPYGDSDGGSHLLAEAAGGIARGTSSGRDVAKALRRWTRR